MTRWHRYRERSVRLAGVGCVLLLLISGCTRESALLETVHFEHELPEDAIVVPANRAWVETGISLQAGEAVTVTGSGEIRLTQPKGWKPDQQLAVGPEGTFLYSDDVAEDQFPIPSAAAGPAPCYCLIGRIGDGPPFYIGRHKSWQADQSGTLKLGINDLDPSDNQGQFQVQITKPQRVQPVAFEERVARDAAGGTPVAGASVVLFYVDGLRPDVVREMVAMGHLPNIDRLFVSGGAWTSNAFTSFPSDTITSNGTMWTGCFSDRHGLKGQVRFSRRTLHSQSYLEPMGPSRSANLLAPQGIDRLVHDAQAASIGLTRGEEEKTRWEQTNVTGVAPLFQHLRSNGGDWATGVLPMMTEMPPLLWTRSMVRHMPYFRSEEAWRYVDDANTHYALRHLLPKDQPVTIIWLPETDSVSHKYSRGQFGMTRRTIALADTMIGRVADQLAAQGRLQSTYFVLVSDHGHHGGQGRHLSNFDLANEFFFKTRQLSSDKTWLGGGLGLSVRQHRFWNRHPEDGSRDFVFVDGDSDGAARVFLPRGKFRSGHWMGEFRPGDLLRYPVSDQLPPINLIQSLTATAAIHGDGSREHPVDLVLAKLTDESILISTLDRGHAVIERKLDADDRWKYRYTVVENLRPTADGRIEFERIENPSIDPLKLYEHVPAQLLSYDHDERIWLRMTAESQYPDSVVALTRHMLWQDNLKYREPEYAPDLVVTARSGWYFGTKASRGTMHGYPLPDAMHATLFFSGPNVRRGARIDEPCRLVDLTPTLLEMVGASFDEDEVDGTPLRSIYREEADSQSERSALYWQDVDLQAWRALEYSPLKPNEDLPFTINRPTSPLDLNNIAYDLLTLTDYSVLRLFDDVLFPLTSEPPITSTVERVEDRIRVSNQSWLADGAQALNVSGVAVGDYSMTSLGNLQRADGAIDWAQGRGKEFDARVAELSGRQESRVGQGLNSGIDKAQAGVWETYRFAQRALAKVLDEMLLNSIEDRTDQAINAFHRPPAEITVEAPDLRPVPRQLDSAE